MMTEVEYDNKFFIDMQKRGERGISLWDIIQSCRSWQFREVCFRKYGVKLKLGKIVNNIGSVEIYLPFPKVKK